MHAQLSDEMALGVVIGLFLVAVHKLARCPDKNCPMCKLLRRR